MKVPIMVRREADLIICGITLLSMVEYESLKENIPRNGTSWWLRSKTIHNCCACVNKSGGVVSATVSNLNWVRPAMEVIGLGRAGLKAGDKVCLLNREWTVISNDYILCDEGVFFGTFNPVSNKDGANEYDHSRVKERLRRWFEDEMTPLLLENMPKCCAKCAFTDDEGCWAGGRYRYWDESGSDCERFRHTDCPLDARAKESCK